MMSSLTILLLLLAVFTSHAFRVTSVTSSTGITASKSSIYAIQSIRGGDNDEYDEYDSDSEEEEEEVKSNLSASTKAALKKAQAKKNAEAKKTVSASLKSKPKKQKSGGIIKKIPYIVRCMLNPFTVFAMTKGYFASLFNIDYLQGDSSQDLRSALEQKARSAPAGGKSKRARKMKPGQAKTISDLPQLNM